MGIVKQMKEDWRTYKNLEKYLQENKEKKTSSLYRLFKQYKKFFDEIKEKKRFDREEMENDIKGLEMDNKNLRKGYVNS